MTTAVTIKKESLGADNPTCVFLGRGENYRFLMHPLVVAGFQRCPAQRLYTAFTMVRAHSGGTGSRAGTGTGQGAEAGVGAGAGARAGRGAGTSAGAGT